MRTIETEVYTYDELPPNAQEVARNNYREHAFDYAWWDNTFDQVKEIGAMLGINIDKLYFSGFWSQGNGASFTGKYAYKKGWKALLNKEFGSDYLAQIVAHGQALQAAQAPAFYTGAAEITVSGRYSHSGSMVVACDLEKGDFAQFEDAITDALRWFADWTYTQLEAEYDYLTSNEQIAEAITSNNYEFTTEGKILEVTHAY